MSKVPSITLNNGVEMPQLGYGVWQVPDDEAAQAVTTAIETGYRSIDTAAIYENEVGTGKAIAASGVAREELFVTTKLWNNASETWTRDGVLREFDASLSKLGLDYVDLYLIHWPRAMRDDYVTIWKAFGELAESGRAKAIGVSNFKEPQLRRIIDESGVVPAVNQVELHPQLAQPELRAFHAEHGIATEAWSPLGQGKGLLEVPTIVAIAQKYAKTPAQIVLRWHLQLGTIAIPKSVTPSRIAENFDVFGFELDTEDIAAIAALDEAKRLGPDPDDFDF
ncbi:aldo/keto reductase [Streptomyces sp. TLI_146]|uniref:aldo/keto reductase n=1 Tax=Streptomyces sp. TLI_146 TaxID=1938858 RepID=UPI000C7147F5|nr:aldo/keto reductase [Streptomyces sp. TLI_146]PKV88849.1 diketogulonate reductase-like aldo/keto reductase [Streptomyces sp. TLI_146]